MAEPIYTVRILLTKSEKEIIQTQGLAVLIKLIRNSEVGLLTDYEIIVMDKIVELFTRLNDRMYF